MKCLLPWRPFVLVLFFLHDVVIVAQPLPSIHNSCTVHTHTHHTHKNLSSNESIVRRTLIAFSNRVDSFLFLAACCYCAICCCINILPVKRDESGFIRMKTVGCYGSMHFANVLVPLHIDRPIVLAVKHIEKSRQFGIYFHWHHSYFRFIRSAHSCVCRFALHVHMYPICMSHQFHSMAHASI